MNRLYHLVSAAEWAAARDDGSYVPPSLGAEGFVHLSYADQVVRVANARYQGRDDLVCVELDADALPVPVVDEDTYDSGERFPHVYAAIPTSAAVAVHPVVRTPSGELTIALP